MNIVQLNKSHVIEITNMLNEAFNSNYTNDEVIESFNDYTYYGISINKKLKAFVSLYNTNKNKEHDNSDVVKNSKYYKIIFISNIVSIVSGLGKRLLKYVISRFRNKPVEIFLTARNIKLVKYYETFGFVRVKTSHPRWKLMKYEG